MDLCRRIESAIDLLDQLQEQAGAGASGVGAGGALLANLHDQLEHLRLDARDADLRLGLLELLVPTRDLDASLIAALHYLMERFDVEAAGMRLREGDDFPYFSTRGFSNEFVVAESSLCHRDAQGCPTQDPSGLANLECMCGAVILGQTDPSAPFFTPGGSFWTNSSTDLLATGLADEGSVHVRGRCNRDGYESVALVPLRSGGQTFGLVQLNDRRRGRFDLGTITLLEDLVEHVARVLG